MFNFLQTQDTLHEKMGTAGFHGQGQASLSRAGGGEVAEDSSRGPHLATPTGFKASGALMISQGEF